jgi:ketosteroid isomerase-like protein
MSIDDNIKTVEAMYEAFGRGDLAAILDSVTEDVDWAADTSSSAAPWYGVRHGKQEVASFFQAFGSTMEVEEFTPLTYATNDDSVLAVVRCRAKSRATGKSIDMNLHHYFRFSGDKVSYYRGTEDTAQTVAVLHG